LVTTFNEEDFDERDTGDGGLDLFGYIPLDFRIKNNIPLFFGQCACGKEWKKKIAECESVTWEGNLDFTQTTKPYHMIFMPRSYRQLDGKWINLRNLRNAIVFDRERIVNSLANSSNSFIDRLPASKVIDDIIQNEIPY
jgi:hypothetical protein